MFWDEVFVVRNSVFIRPLSLENEAILKCNSAWLIVLSFTFKHVSKDHGDGFSRSQEKGM